MRAKVRVRLYDLTVNKRWEKRKKSSHVTWQYTKPIPPDSEKEVIVAWGPKIMQRSRTEMGKKEYPPFLREQFPGAIGMTDKLGH